MNIEKLNKIKANVRRKAEKAAYCRGLEAGRKEQRTKDKFVIESIKEEHHYDRVFLIEMACEWIEENVDIVICKGSHKPLSQFISHFRKAMEE